MRVFEELKILEAFSYQEEIIAILQDVQGKSDESSPEHGSRADSIGSLHAHSIAELSGKQARAQSFQSAWSRICQSLLPWHASRQGSNQTWTLTCTLDPAVGEVNWLSEDFSSVILNRVTMPLTRCETSWTSWEVGSGKNRREAYLAKLDRKDRLAKDNVILSIGTMLAGIPKEFRTKSAAFLHYKKGTGRGLA